MDIIELYLFDYFIFFPIFVCFYIVMLIIILWWIVELEQAGSMHGVISWLTLMLGVSIIF